MVAIRAFGGRTGEQPVGGGVVHRVVDVQPEVGSAHGQELLRRIVTAAGGPETQPRRIHNRDHIDDLIQQMPDPIIERIRHEYVDTRGRHSQRCVEQ